MPELTSKQIYLVVTWRMLAVRLLEHLGWYISSAACTCQDKSPDDKASITLCLILCIRWHARMQQSCVHIGEQDI